MPLQLHSKNGSLAYVRRGARVVFRGQAAESRSGEPSNSATVNQADDLVGSDFVEELSTEFQLTPVAAQILFGRGIDTLQKAKSYLLPSLREDLRDPEEITGLRDAAKLLIQAVLQQKHITIYSDFDVDGLTSAAQLDQYLSALGGRVTHYVPNRFSEGYGLVSSAVEKLAQAKTELLVTVDCGITSHKEIALAKRLGMQTIVLDHHKPQGLPPADVVVDPARSDEEHEKFPLCAAGLIWMLLIVLRREYCASTKNKPEQVSAPDPKEFLDLAAIGTICDMVPLKGLNRLIAHRGVEALKTTSRVGLEALKNAAGLTSARRLGAGHVSFLIGPRINAAGRLDDAGEVFELLTTKSSPRAQALAERVSKLNSERQAIEERVRRACIAQLEAQPKLMENSGFAIFGEDFHTGVIGIAAQRLVEQFYRPAAVMGPGEITIDGKLERIIKGSVRGIRGFHVADALSALDSYLHSHGGHAQAGGFSVRYEAVEEFQREFLELANRVLSESSLQRELTADLAVTLDQISFDLVEELSRFAPFGIGNPSPLLVTEGLTVDFVQSLQNGHLRLRLTDGKNIIGAVAWRFQGHPELRKGKEISVAYQPEINTYKGVSSVQLNIKEAWAAE